MIESGAVIRKDEKIFILIMNVLKENNFYKKLHMVLLLTSNLPSEIITKYKIDELKENIKSLLLDPEFVRVINFRESIILDDSNVYFGPDHIDCPYNYNEQLDKLIGEIDYNITQFLGNIVSELDIHLPVDLGEIND